MRSGDTAAHSAARILALILVSLFGAAAPRAADSGTETDRKTVAALDVEYQAAVKANDAATMKRILHEDFVLVLGDGREFDRDDLLAAARSGAYRYEKQDEVEGTQIVRVWGDAAVVTAKLWVKGTRDGEPFDRKLWFSDTYVRTTNGWKYVLGQASLPLPDGE